MTLRAKCQVIYFIHPILTVIMGKSVKSDSSGWGIPYINNNACIYLIGNMIFNRRKSQSVKIPIAESEMEGKGMVRA